MVADPGAGEQSMEQRLVETAWIAVVGVLRSGPGFEPGPLEALREEATISSAISRLTRRPRRS